jgi:hypothetical protein
MLFEARRLALEHRPVYVFGANREHCEELRRQFEELTGVSPEVIGILIRPVPVQYNWQAMYAPGWGEPGKPYLIDHHVIEHHFAKMLKELHRFDSNPPENHWPLIH